MSVFYVLIGALLASLPLQSWILPLVVAIVALTLCVLAVCHEHALLPPEIQGFRPLMDILDRITNKTKLQAMFDAAPVGDVSKEIDRDAMRRILQEEIIGHDAVIDEVVAQVWGAFKMEERSQAVAVFMFAGPPSTGKTEFGRAIGKALYGELGFFQISMESFSSAHSGSTLGGSSPGQVGSQTPSGLVSHLVAHPATVVILDEFEKAHIDNQRMFLSAWNNGYFMDMTTGKKVVTSNAIFVVTTNAAQDALAKLAETFRGTSEELSDRCKEVLRATFDEALLSRVTYVFPLQPLREMKLAALLGKSAVEIVRKYGLTLVQVTPETLYGYAQEASRRGVDNRAMQRKIIKDIREQVIHLKDAGHRQVVISERDGQVIVEPFREPTKAPPPKPEPPKTKVKAR